MEAITNLWQSFPPRLQLALIGLTLTIAKDLHSYNKSKALMKAEGKDAPEFNWGLSVPMWYLGFMGGYGIGTGAEAVTPPEVSPTDPVAMLSLFA